jgi:hypothetical protein
MSLLGEVGFLAQNERVWKTLGGLSKTRVKWELGIFGFSLVGDDVPRTIPE